MKDLKTVKEIAALFNVTESGVRYWISKGLKYKTEKVIGLRPRKMISPKDVENFLNLGFNKEGK